MAEDTMTEALPPVRHWPALDLTGVDFDPVLTELMREGPVTRIELPHGEGWAWLVTRHDDVRMVTNDPRFSRPAVMDRPVTRLAPHFIPDRGAVGFLDPPDHARLRRTVAAAFTASGVERVREKSRRMLDELLQDGPPADPAVVRDAGPAGVRADGRRAARPDAGTAARGTAGSSTLQEGCVDPWPPSPARDVVSGP